jgi:hypothetical protein
MDVVIRGDGVAAYCCAYLLSKAGFRILLESIDRPRLPAIMLGEQALALIRDVFEKPGFLNSQPRIKKRIVSWGSSAKPVALEHSAVVVSEEALLAEIRPLPVPDRTPAQEANWTILAARPLPAQTAEHHFGSRMASALPVTLNDHSDPSTCWIESLDDGWLFLIPNAFRSGWLLAIGDAPEVLLDQSSVVAPQIAQCGPSRGKFPAYARIASPLGAPGWLACGTAAMAFDPICGDGTAHAIREAILAAAVIRAISSGGPAADLLWHYEARLTAGFRRHLELCRGYYQSGGTEPLWRAELAAIDRGIRWCEARLDPKFKTGAGFRYRLRGFELEAV